MPHLSPQVCLTWAIMSVLVSDFQSHVELGLDRWLDENRTSSARSVAGISGIVRGSVASSELRLLACLSSIQLTPGNQIQWDQVRPVPVHHASTSCQELSRTLMVCRRRDRQYLHVSSILTLMVFSIGFATLKYQEGFVVVGIEGGVIFCFSLVDPH